MEPTQKDSDITVQFIKKCENIDISFTRLEKLVKAVCKRFKLSKAAVSIAIVGNSEITQLNKKFLDHNRTTDCLSFDLSENDQPEKSFELLVNGEKALEEANVREHSSQAELALYITHSLLHLLGFDDSSKEQAKKMHDTEDEILQQQGFGLVYNKRPS